jgi:hypothetical protein
VPLSGLPYIVAPNRSQPLRVAIQVRENAANIGRIERHVDDRIRPIELLLEFLRAWRLADHYCACRGPLVEPRGDHIAACRKLGFIHIAAIGDVVAAVFEQCCQHTAMFVRAVDAERAVLPVGAARGHGVVVVEALPPLGVIEQRLMREGRAPAYVANLDRARLIGRSRRETRYVNGERQVGARSTGDARYVLNAVTDPNEDVSL